jgi:uncharacterized protein
VKGGERPIVCVFAKPPVAGSVKTRLAADLGVCSAELAAAFLLDTWAGACRLGWARVVLATTDRSEHEAQLDGLTERDTWLQGQGDLGERLERVLARALCEAPLVIAIGADTPGLPRALVEQARRALGRSESVLGPCADGGFYLLGLRRCPARLLAALPWSCADTFQQTRARLQCAGLNPASLPHWFDIDRKRDLARLWRLLRAGRVAAPATARALEKLADLEP